MSSSHRGAKFSSSGLNLCVEHSLNTIAKKERAQDATRETREPIPRYLEMLFTAETYVMDPNAQRKMG